MDDNKDELVQLFGFRTWDQVLGYPLYQIVNVGSFKCHHKANRNPLVFRGELGADQVVFHQFGVAKLEQQWSANMDPSRNSKPGGFRVHGTGTPGCVSLIWGSKIIP